MQNSGQIGSPDLNDCKCLLIIWKWPKLVEFIEHAAVFLTCYIITGSLYRLKKHKIVVLPDLLLQIRSGFCFL